MSYVRGWSLAVVYGINTEEKHKSVIVLAAVMAETWDFFVYKHLGCTSLGLEHTFSVGL